LQKLQISSLEQFRPPPNKSGSKPNFFIYLLEAKGIFKNGQIRPKMALFLPFSPNLKIGKLLEQGGRRQVAGFSRSVAQSVPDS
jgi:hypothetical protein